MIISSIFYEKFKLYVSLSVNLDKPTWIMGTEHAEMSHLDPRLWVDIRGQLPIHNVSHCAPATLGMFYSNSFHHNCSYINDNRFNLQISC